MRRFALVASVLALASVAHADDPREVFGLPKKPKTTQDQPKPDKPDKPDDVRDAFGFGKKASDEPVDCTDGTAFGCAGASDPLDEHASPYSLVSWLPAPYLLSLPVADATHEAVAHYALGATRDETNVIIIAGATGLENRWTVDGAPAENVRTGNVDTRIPLVFLTGIRVTAGGFTARDRTSTGGTIDAVLIDGTDDHQVNAHAFFTWFADSRHRSISPSTYLVRRGFANDGPGASLSLVATGPLGSLLDGDLHYVAGVAPELASTEFHFTSQTITDRDNDGVPDGLPALVSTVGIDRTDTTPLTYRIPVLGRLQWAGDVSSLDLSLVGTASNDVFYLFNSTLQAAGVSSRSFVGDGIATWRGKWTNTRGRAQLAWHRSQRHEYATDPAAADIPQLLSAYVPTVLPDDPEVAKRCNDDDPADLYPNVANCPIPFGWFASGGAGALSDETGDRPSLTLDVAHRIGNNVVRAGATGEDTRFVVETRFTGGTQIRSLFPGHTQERRFADPTQICHPDVGSSCPTVDTSVLRFRTRYTAAYLEDTWHPTPDIAVDGGLRWELMWVGTALHFSNEWSPRLGIGWDPLGNGRSRVWTSMGRSYALLPAGLGTTILQRARTVDKIVSQLGEGRSVDTGAVIAVAPDIQPIAQDELTTGAQVALAKTVRLTTWLEGRWLRRGIDTTTHGFDNPGRYGGTPALRETGVFAAEIETAPTSKLVLRAGYMYGRTIGSWTGAFDPRQGAVLYAGTDYDTTSVNQLGVLPTDIGHQVFVEGQRGGKVGPVELTIATRLTAGSGRPRSALGLSDDGIIFLIPRGTAGRGPLLTQANVRVAARWHDVDITLDLFNVFDQREATNVEELYATGSIRPIDHGEVTDLLFLKDESGADTGRSATYRKATAFQAPFAAALGIHRAF